MARNVPLARRKRADALPVCIFPRGRKAGIRCVTLQILIVAGRKVEICRESMCGYFEGAEEDEL